MRRDQVTKLMLTATATAALASGCLLDRPYDIEPGVEAVDPTNTDPPRGPYEVVRGAIDGHILGQVGPVTGLNHDASAMMAFDDGEYASIETVVELQDRATMTLLSIVGPRTVLRPGFQGSFSLESYSSSEVNVTMLGCVGQEVDVYDEYDMPADEVTVEVADGAAGDEIAVTVQGTWYDHDPATGTRLETFHEANTNFTLLR